MAVSYKKFLHLMIERDIVKTEENVTSTNKLYNIFKREDNYRKIGGCIYNGRI